MPRPSPRSRRRIAAATALLAIGVSAPVVLAANPSQAAPPLNPLCLPLAAGTTGLYGVGTTLPVLSQELASDGIGGLGPVADRPLPRRVWFKDGRHAISNTWAFALRDGDLFVAPAERGVVGPGERWRRVVLPACLAGRVAHVSADNRLLTVQTADGQVYSNDMPGNDLSPERWTWRWGPYLWIGAGVRIWRDVTAAAASEFAAPETFTDVAGRRHQPIGVATYYLLRDGGRRITYLDPWLPSDRSREVCTPDDGSTRLANLDASGSTVFAVARDGSLHTRLYDFDISGANPIFGSYTWQTGLGPRDSRWQLPAPGWERQAPPPGPITDQVSIVRTGLDAAQRELRVAARWQGRTGVWTRPLAGQRWSFHPGRVQLGRRLPLRGSDTVRPQTVRFLGSLAGAPAEIGSFDWACTPTPLRVRVGGRWLALRLWAYDALRQHPRAVGLDDVPRLYNAAIELPPSSRADLWPAARSWVARHLDGRFTVAPIEVTATRLRFRVQCWQLTADGAPPRPDALAVPDTGTLLDAVMEIRDGGVPAGRC
ncbi:hypothetical protein [Nocardioides sp. R-C-SC26]|uniref:hypothetical protein n=1 Tax=Nocardioides sp. R-C-SC26 TaxID=2870414 RepID=UPI001E2B3C5D|nr:hypothetical protein [Nocardioides sp. R-C-SC26]